jgi:hypothetical protein
MFYVVRLPADTESAGRMGFATTFVFAPRPGIIEGGFTTQEAAERSAASFRSDKHRYLVIEASDAHSASLQALQTKSPPPRGDR